MRSHSRMADSWGHHVEVVRFIEPQPMPDAHHGLDVSHSVFARYAGAGNRRDHDARQPASHGPECTNPETVSGRWFAG